MTQDSTEATCQHCGGKLRVYATRYTANFKIQHRRCKNCKAIADSKRVPNELAQRLAELEKKVAQILEKSID